MTTLHQDLHHKDVAPEETIARIQGILAEVGVSLVQAQWWSLEDHCYSVRVGVETMPDPVPVIGQNGKGRTQLLALASACAEVMERLQNGIFFPTRFGLMSEPRLVRPPDETTMTPLDLWDSSSPALRDVVFADGLTRDDLDADAAIPVLPFYNVNRGAIECVPSELLNSSNGMCAGNSPDEAIVQGLGEILERFVLSKLLFEGPRLPTIPHEEIAHLECYDIVRYLHGEGYRVIVKDCTLGGRFPVLAVVLFHPDRLRYAVHLGADPVLNVAIQRTLTEMFQGVSRPDPKLLTPDLDFSERGRGALTAEDCRLFDACMRGENAPFPNSILLPAGPPRHHEAFGAAGADNHAMLRDLVGRVTADGHTLYVRDVSFLGFPSYKVFVPTMPYAATLPKPVWPRDGGGASRQQAITPFLLRMGHEPLEAVEEMATRIEQQLGGATQSLLGITTEGADPFSSLHQTDFLLAVMYSAAGDYAKGGEWLRRYMTRASASAGVEIANNDYATCVLMALHLRASDVSAAETLATLSELFGDDLAAEVLDDLPGPEKGGFTLPVAHCGDCKKCPVGAVCYYEPWSAIIAKINEKIVGNPIDQERLARVFG